MRLQLLPTILLCSALLSSVHSSSGGSHSNSSSIAVAKWKFEEFSGFITVILFILAVILIKMGLQHIPYLAEFVPESFLLIALGVIFGASVKFGIKVGSFSQNMWTLTPELFFHFLLPPIILEASYSLYNRTFSDYLGTVLVFAVFGTIFNFLIIGFLMYGLSKIGAMGYPDPHFDLKGYLLFSSLIVAVDPVAVLAIFQDIGVELSLYYLVFGESLLNDAITVVLYEIMAAFVGQDVVTGEQIAVGIASFFTVSFGGLLIGVVIGIISCLITRIRSRLNAVTLILLAYFSYIMADTVGWSGIISMIGCGLLQAAYAFNNLDTQSLTTVHQLMKDVSEISESVIFLFLGGELLGSHLEWHTGFVLWAMVSCLVARVVVIFGITGIVNKVQHEERCISYAEQFILFYGGLRGAVAFSLAVLVVPETLGDHGEYNRNVIMTATLFIILFTVGIMGMTMKPLVKLLKIRMKQKDCLSLFQVLMDHVLDESLAAIEELVDAKGRNALREFFIRLDERYLRRILQRDPGGYDHELIEVYEKIDLELHYAEMKPNDVESILKNLPDPLKREYLMHAQNAQKEPTPELPSVERLDVEAAQAELTTMGAQQFDSKIQSTHKATILPKDKRRANYNEAIRDILRSRNQVIRQRIKTRMRHSIAGGSLQSGFITNTRL